MSEHHVDLYKEVQEAIKDLFSDQTVDQEQTAEDLRSLIHEIEELIETLDV